MGVGGELSSSIGSVLIRTGSDRCLLSGLPETEGSSTCAQGGCYGPVGSSWLIPLVRLRGDCYSQGEG